MGEGEEETLITACRVRIHQRYQLPNAEITYNYDVAHLKLSICTIL